MTQETDRARRIRYLQDASELRFTIEQNILDSNFVSKGGRIVYLVDANVVGLFLDPAEEASHVTPFSAVTGPHVLGTALVAAEYIFSRRLPGQRDSPTLISPDHAEDLSRVISALGRAARSSSGALNTEPTEFDKGRLVRLVEQLKLLKADPIQARRRLEEELPGLVSGLLNGPAAVATQLLRLYDNDLIRPLDAHPSTTREVLEPPSRLVNDWTELINTERLSAMVRSDRARRMAKRPSGQGAVRSLSTKRRLDLDQADARTLVQLQMLQQSVDERHSRRRYVLISSDKVLHRAYANWFWSHKNTEKEPKSYLLRHPIQFLPVLNTADMPNGERRTLIYDVKAALDTLLKSVQQVDHLYPWTLSHHAAQMEYYKDSSMAELLNIIFTPKLPDIDINDVPLRRTLEAWKKCFDDGILQNAGFLRRRSESEFKMLDDLVSSQSNLLNAIREHQQKQLQKVEFAHLAIGTTVKLQWLLRAGASAVGKPGRAPFSVHINLRQLLGEEVDWRFLDKFVNSQPLNKLEEALLRPGSFRAMFFGACVAFRLQLWPAVQHYLDRARAFLNDSPELEPGETVGGLKHELAHLLAVSMRYSDQSGSSFKSTDEKLRDAADYFMANGDIFREARALSERATWRLRDVWTACVLKGCPPSKMSSDFDLLIIEDKLGECSDLAETSEGGRLYGAYTIVRIQQSLNLIGVELVHRHYGVKGPAFPVSSLRKAISYIESLVSQSGIPQIVLVCALCLRWHFSTSEVEKATLADRILTICNEALQDGNSGLTDLDRAEFVEFRRILTDKALVASQAT